MNKITIVTVCYNAEETIKNTIESVLSQNYCNYEYIVIDGKSTDNTLTILTDYRKAFKEKGIGYYISSEKDNGIYDAMNKGIEHSSGDWIIFMNADDSFYSSDVLTQVFDKDLANYDVVYGDCMRNDGNGSYLLKANPVETLPKQMPFMHQSVFVKRGLCLKYKFDLSYRLCADYNFFFTLYAEGYKFLQTDCIICNYSISGISGKALIKAQKEVISIKKKFGIQYPITNKDRFKWKADELIMRIKMHTPTKVLQRLRKIKNST